MTDPHRPPAVLALPLLCCAGHALLLAMGASSVGALLTARAPLVGLVGLLLLSGLGLAALAALRSPRPRTRSEQSCPPPPPR